MSERHARHRRAPADPRRRPIDGFRAGSAARFDELVRLALAGLPETVAEPVGALEVRVLAVPPEPATGPPDLIRYAPPRRPRAAHHITLYRRALEARAQTAADLTELIRHLVAEELSRALGLDDGN